MSPQSQSPSRAQRRIRQERTRIRQEFGQTSRDSHTRPRAGFTLVELMMVIVIITILVGLLVPVISSARNRARETRVIVELQDLKTAINQFKVTFGVEPPSRITLSENGTTWAPRDRAIIRRMWPQFNFSTSALRDFNGDGDTDDTIELNGAECLVFFLGGVIERTQPSPPPAPPTGYNVVGFSKNPTNPFSPPTAGNTATREGPFTEFDVTRFVDTNGNRMPEYLDSLPSQQLPIIYLSSYDGRGYATDDSAALTSITGTPFLAYVLEDQINVAYNQKSFQLISPGSDAQYGQGGPYDPDNTNMLFTGPRAAEHDNLTNFHNSRLGQ